MPAVLFNSLSAYPGIKDSLGQLYLSDPRPWLVGFSGGKHSTLAAALLFEAAPANITCRKQARFANADLSAAKLLAFASHAKANGAHIVERARARGLKLATLDDGLCQKLWAT